MKELDNKKDASPAPEGAIHRENRAHRILVRVLLLVMVVEWVVLLIDKFWLSAFLVTLIIATLLSPIIFRKKMEMEFQPNSILRPLSSYLRRSILAKFRISTTGFGGGISPFTHLQAC